MEILTSTFTGVQAIAVAITSFLFGASAAALLIARAYANRKRITRQRTKELLRAVNGGRLAR